jgi:hypothetical protein
MALQAFSTEISQNLSWAQGAAGSNPAAPINKYGLISIGSFGQVALVGPPWVQGAG